MPQYKLFSKITQNKFDNIYAGNDIIICGKIQNINDINTTKIEVHINAKTGTKDNNNEYKFININTANIININKDTYSNKKYVVVVVPLH